MKRLLLFLCILCCTNSFAAHIIGGEFRYEYVGPGTTPGSKIYKIILLLVKGDNTAGAPLANSYVVGIYNNDNGVKFPGTSVNQTWTITMENPGIQSLPIVISPCLTNAPTLIYTWANYAATIEFPQNASGYTIAYQTCCRQTGMQNVDASGSTYSCVIPGTNTLPSPLIDNSPKYKLPISVICQNSQFTLDFSATDADGDSLVYGFCDAYNGGDAIDVSFDNPAGPPYPVVPYINGFNSTIPLGNLATINPATGIISGISPAAGNYVVCVCVREYRNGRLINTHRKDLMVRVSDCIITRAVTNPGYITCDGFNIQFNHSSTGANNVFWDFGDPSTNTDTSSLENPVYIYPDTGIFIVKFWINKGESCTDSTTITMGIYPGFSPGFLANAPFCSGVPVQFMDTSRTEYGVINSWSWNFGDGTTLSDTSHVNTPTYTYASPGTYSTVLTVTNSKGCTKTVPKDVTILPTPTLSVSPRDTFYCARDTIRLTATGAGTFNWLPNSNIIGATTATPQVFPSSSTYYYATITLNGCKKTDSIRVNPLNDLTNAITALPDTICRLDSSLLSGTANHTGVTWQWAPASLVRNPMAQNTYAFPSVPTNFTLTTKWGNNCVTSSSKNIFVRPLAIPVAGNDKDYCIGQTAVQLNASGGISYSWSPSTGLSDPNIANPLASPTVTTDYIVAVGVNGCSRRMNDTLTVTAIQKPTLNVTNDTLICIIDTLRLIASGTALNYTWTPNYMILNSGTATPLVSPDIPTMYYVTLTDAFGCFKKDSVFVDVKPDVFVNAGNDSSICKGDQFIINATGDAVTYSWSPPRGLNNVNIRNPIAAPDTTLIYTVRANIGKCEKTDQVKFIVAPVPVAIASEDTTVCTGFSTQIFASGGSQYLWTPSLFLSNPLIANPTVILPTWTMKYVVTVSDTLGCTRATKDSVIVQLIPPVRVDAGPPDTSVVVGQPLNLLASGALTYIWNPFTWLNGVNISNPVSIPQETIKYFVTGTDPYGCKGSDSILVRVYDVVSSMYVPTAFTPNGDGLNDDVKPIMLGMRSLNYFRVYNRFGEMVFATTQQHKGWDGVYLGKSQDAATFVWMAQGVTYKGQVITKKGYVVLIR